MKMIKLILPNYTRCSSSRNRASSDPVEQVSHDTSEGTGSPQLTLAGRVIKISSTPHDEFSTSNG